MRQKYVLEEKKSRLKGLCHSPEIDAMLCPKNKNDKVFNIPLKSEKSPLVSCLIRVSDMSYTTVTAIS